MSERRTAGIFVAVEYCHSTRFMITELAVPVELSQIIETAISCTRIYLTAIDGPSHRLMVIHALVIGNRTVIRVNPLQLWVHILVADTTLLLYHRIVKRNLGNKLQTLGQEIEFLGKDKVGGNLCIGTILHTASGKTHHRVRTVGLTWSIISISTVRINRTHGIWSCMIDRSPISTGIARLVPREMADTVTTEKVGREQSSLGQIEVQVGTHVNTVIAETSLIATTAGEVLEQVTFVSEVYRCEIFHEFGTSRNIHAGIVRHGCVVEQLLLPVNVRIAVPFFSIGRMTILVDDGHRLVGTPCFFVADVQLALHHSVQESESIIRIIFLRQLGNHLHGSIRLHVYGSLAFLTTLGSNEDDTVTTLHTINGSGRSILQYGDALY